MTNEAPPVSRNAPVDPAAKPVLGGSMRSTLLSPTVALLALLLVSLVFRVYNLNTPDDGLIYDETHYVNAARKILGLSTPSSSFYAFQPSGIDPNLEHPPLGKLLIAGSMSMLGDNVYGWRLPSLLAGLACIGLLYGVVRGAGGHPWLAVLAATLFAFDNLVFVHSRIAMLDMLMLAPMLMAVALYVTRQPLAAGIVLAIAALVKITAVYGLGALILVEMVRAYWGWKDGEGLPRERVRSALLLVGGFIPVWFAVLWLLDLGVTPFKAPWEHLSYILSYGIALGNPDGPVRWQSRPWMWVVNEGQIPYFIQFTQVETPFQRIIEQVQVNNQAIGTNRAIIYFRGAMNPAIIGATIPALSYAAWRVWKFRDELALWAVSWALACYLPYFPLSFLQNRQTYIFYFLPVLPAAAIAIAKLLQETKLPRVVTWGLLFAVGVGFLAYFPFRWHL